MSFLVLNEISHTYFSKKTLTTALEDISFTVEEGEFVSFLGPSGCGKTTLLSIIAGLLQPTDGSVWIDNKKVTKADSSIGYMLQQDYLFPWKTIEENVLIGLKIMENTSKDAKENALKLLDEIGLYGVRNSYPRQLSGGMRQRVALVRTLATNPKMLLLDEPFSALDYLTKLKLEDLVFQILKDYKKTAVLVTHDIGEAIAMSDKIYLFSANPGKVAKVFHVPLEICECMPFSTRQLNSYSNLFQEIWKELEQLETAQS